MDDSTRTDATQDQVPTSNPLMGSSPTPAAASTQYPPSQPTPIKSGPISSSSGQTGVQSGPTPPESPLQSAAGTQIPVQPPFIQQEPVTQQSTPVVQNVPSSPQTPPSSMPDLTSVKQVSQPVMSSVPIVPESPPPASSPAQSSVKKHGFALPRPLLFIGLGVIFIVILLIVFKFLSTLFQAGGHEKVTITYWGLWEDKSVMQAVINDFERQNPNIIVTYTKQDPHDYSKSLLTRIQNGTGPDIYRYHVSWLPMMLPSLLPLSTDVINKNDFVKAYYPVIQNDLIKNGALYGIPLEIDTLSLYINNKIFNTAKASPPTTWDTFITTARALTVKDNNGKIQTAGAAMGTFDNITHAPDIMSLLFVQNGVSLSTMTPSSNASDALNFYTSFALDQNNVWDDTLDPSLLAFERGKLAMYIGYSYDIFALKATSPDLDFSIYPVPHLPGRDSTIASYWVEGISSKTTHPKEALLFMHFLAQKDTATKLYTQEAKLRLFGEPYARVDLADSLKSDKLVYPFVSQASNAASSYFAGETQDTGINSEMNGYLGNAIKSIQKETSVDTAVETLTKGVTQILNQYGQ